MHLQSFPAVRKVGLTFASSRRSVHEKAPRRSVSSRYALGQGDYDAHVLNLQERVHAVRQSDPEVAYDAPVLVDCGEDEVSQWGWEFVGNFPIPSLQNQELTFGSVFGLTSAQINLFGTTSAFKI